MMTRIYKCSICGNSKPFEDFVKRNNRPKNKRQPYCKKCHNERKRNDYKKEYARKWHMSSSYGISEEQYSALLKLQNGTCAICESVPQPNEKKGFLSIDHDHETNKIRGLLCDSCNRGIGLLKESPKNMSKALMYLLADQTDMIAIFKKKNKKYDK